MKHSHSRPAWRTRSHSPVRVSPFGEVEGGGWVEGLPTFTFLSDDGDVDALCPTEIGITERRELSSLGLLPLTYLRNSDDAGLCSMDHRCVRWGKMMLGLFPVTVRGGLSCRSKPVPSVAITSQSSVIA